MSLRDNPILAEATEEQLQKLAMKLRILSVTPQKQAGMLAAESGTKRVRKTNAATSQKLLNLANEE